MTDALEVEKPCKIWFLFVLCYRNSYEYLNTILCHFTFYVTEHLMLTIQKEAGFIADYSFWLQWFCTMLMVVSMGWTKLLTLWLLIASKEWRNKQRQYTTFNNMCPVVYFSHLASTFSCLSANTTFKLWVLERINSLVR